MANFLKSRLREALTEKISARRDKTPEAGATAPEHRAIEREASPESVEAHAHKRHIDPSQAPAEAQYHGRVAPLTERVQTPHTKSERLVAIEQVMSDGLRDIYVTLTPEQQSQVKKSGEEAATKIEALLEQGKLAAKKIVLLLRDWLKKIPGINMYFLEQESKIKTDRILAIAKKGRG